MFQALQARENVPFYTMVFTDGMSNEGPKVEIEAPRLHKAVDRVYVVGIDATEGIEEDELYVIASNSSYVKGILIIKLRLTHFSYFPV